jgi:hypothetical protein
MLPGDQLDRIDTENSDLILAVRVEMGDVMG